MGKIGKQIQNNIVTVQINAEIWIVYTDLNSPQDSIVEK